MIEEGDTPFSPQALASSHGRDAAEVSEKFLSS